MQCSLLFSPLFQGLQSHSTGCTEGFYRENMVRELQGTRSSQSERQRMLATLQRLHLEGEQEEAEGEDDADDVEDEGIDWISHETVTKVLAGDCQLSLEDLTPEEQKALRRAVAAGELSRLVDVWQPWWTLPAARTMSLSCSGGALVKDNQVDKEEGLETVGIPSPPETDIPPLISLSTNKPSPLLIVHLVDILYGYCFTLRLYNGEWTSDPFGAAVSLLGISMVLGHGATPENADTALFGCLQRVCSAEWRDCGGVAYGVSVMGDVASIMDLGRPGVVCSLADCQRMVEAATGTAPRNDRRGPLAGLSGSEGGTVGVKSGTKTKGEFRQLQLVSRKLRYFLAWANEQSPDVYRAIVLLVRACQQKQIEELDVHKAVATDPSTGLHSRSESDKSKKLLITELPELKSDTLLSVELLSGNK